MGLSALAIAILLMGQASAEGRRVEAEGFIVRDSAGATSARNWECMWMDRWVSYSATRPEGFAPWWFPRLVDVHTPFTGQDRTVYGLTPDASPVPSLRDQSGHARVDLVVTGSSLVCLDLRDQSGKPRAALLVAKDGVPTLSLTDQAGRTLFEVPWPVCS